LKPCWKEIQYLKCEKDEYVYRYKDTEPMLFLVILNGSVDVHIPKAAEIKLEAGAES
jgi:hypothetical protein